MSPLRPNVDPLRIGMDSRGHSGTQPNAATPFWIWQMHAWVCLVVFEDLKSETECLVYPLRKIKQLVFEAPRLTKLIGKKQAVYLETLIKHGIMEK